MGRRDIPADLLWGMRIALGLTALLFTPAFLAVLFTPDELPAFGKVLLAYLVFGCVAGAFAGLFRPSLRKEHGAIAIGCVVGIAGFLTILFLADGPQHYSLLTGVLVTATMGGVVGSFFGWWMLQRVKFWKRMGEDAKGR